MKAIDPRLTHEEQILMQREIGAIKNRMEQMVAHARSGQMQPFERAVMLQSMQGMAGQVNMIRQRCKHVFTVEYTSQDDAVFTSEQICIICEIRQSS